MSSVWFSALFWSVDKNQTETTAKNCLLLSSLCLHESCCHKFWTLSTSDSYSHSNLATGGECFPMLFRDMVLAHESWVICLWSLRSLRKSGFMPWLQGFRPQWARHHLYLHKQLCVLHMLAARVSVSEKITFSLGGVRLKRESPVL